MLKKWSKIFVSTDPIKVKIISQMLEENNITTVIINKQDSSYNMFGNIELYTQDINYENAVKILKNKENE